MGALTCTVAVFPPSVYETSVLFTKSSLSDSSSEFTPSSLTSKPVTLTFHVIATRNVDAVTYSLYVVEPSMLVTWIDPLDAPSPRSSSSPPPSSPDEDDGEGADEDDGPDDMLAIADADEVGDAAAEDDVDGLGEADGLTDALADDVGDGVADASRTAIENESRRTLFAVSTTDTLTATLPTEEGVPVKE